jgi:cephalosporin hydroxylase
MAFVILAVILGSFAIFIFFNRRWNRIASLLKRPVCELFHYFYYRESQTTWQDTAWMGVPLLKLPLDLWIYQEIIHETQPDVIVETGTNQGGSALYFANLCDIAGRGRILTVDISAPPQGTPQHPRIEYLIGSSTNPDILNHIRAAIRPAERVMVVLDSDHSEAHVRRELDLYSPLVTAGCYLVVEDTNVNGHPVLHSHGPGPMEAVNAFLPTNGMFSVDLSREKFGVTFSPRGWLKRNMSPEGSAQGVEELPAVASQRQRRHSEVALKP